MLEIELVDCLVSKVDLRIGRYEICMYHKDNRDVEHVYMKG